MLSNIFENVGTFLKNVVRSHQKNVVRSLQKNVD
jgi:hypothetical protein